MMHSSISRNKKPLTTIAVAILVWQIASLFTPDIMLPGPLLTLRGISGFLQSGEFYTALGYSLIKLVIGIGIAIVIGCGAGLLIGSVPKWHGYAEPIVDMMQSIPPISWLGISMIWFGLTTGPTIFIIVLATTPILFINVYEGFAGIDKKLMQMGQLYKIPRNKILRHIVLPSLKIPFKSGLLVAAGLGWKLTIMGEHLTLAKGLGNLLSQARMNLEMYKVFAISLLIAFLWFGIKFVLIRLMGYRPASSSKAKELTH